MVELTEFPPEEQELIKEMLSLDYTREDFEKRKRVILSSLSTDGLRYVQEHLFDSVFKKLETDANKAIVELEKLEHEQKEKQEFAIQQYKKEERIKCNYRIAGALVVIITLAAICLGVML